MAKISVKEFNKNKEDIKVRLEKANFFGKELWQKPRKSILLTLTITTDCNFRCRYCYLNAGEKPEYMESKIALGIVRAELKDSSGEISIHFFGGEPTLNMACIKKVVAFIKKKKIKHQFHITTNGAVPNQDFDYLTKNNFGFTVSMDSIPAINDKERTFENGKGTSLIVEKTIKKLIERKVKMSIRTTITKSNINYFPDAVKYWSSLGVKYIHFEFVNPIGRGGDLPIVKIKDYIKYIKKALNVAEKKNTFIINSAYMNLLTPSDYFCMSCKGERLIFLPDGTISLCYEAQKSNPDCRNFIVGNYDKNRQEIILDKNGLKKMQKINVDSFEKCKNCFAKHICGGGCPKRNLEATGSFFKPNPYDCKVKKELIKDAIIRIYNSSQNGKLNPVFGTSILENT